MKILSHTSKREATIERYLGNYMFRQIEKEEVQAVFELILDRIEWVNYPRPKGHGLVTAQSY